MMTLVIDTSVIIAVLTSEPERSKLIRVTQGAELMAPASVHWEVGNALSALLKRKRVTSGQIQRALKAYSRIPIRFVEMDLAVALEIADRHGIYAYDAYLTSCAVLHRAPLLTLDLGLRRVATAEGVRIVEVLE